MEHVQFDQEDNGQGSASFRQAATANKRSSIISKLTDWGVVKSEKQAKLVLIVVTIVCCAVIAFVVLGQQRTASKIDPSNINPDTGLPYGVPLSS